jgi:hypothetical protein
MKILVFLALLTCSVAQLYAQIDPQKSFYLTKSEKYRKMKTTGTVLSVGGTILAVVGIVTLSNYTEEVVTNQYGQSQTVTHGNATAGALAYLAGVASIGAGVPLWIVGGISEAKYNRKLEGLTVRLKVNPRSAGIGICYRF